MKWAWIAAFGLMGCAGEPGSVAVSIWGEEGPVDGFAAEDLADGWSVSFDTWLVAATALQVSDPENDEVLAEDAGSFVVDLHQTTDPLSITAFEAPSGRFAFGYALDVPSDSAVLADGVDGAAVDAMRAGGLAHWITGTATDGTETVGFTWGFANPASYSRCENGRDGTAGLAIPEAAEIGAEITIHADHVLWDRLGTEEAQLVFAPIASLDADDDGVVDTDELRAGDPVALGYEASGLDLPTMYDFLAFSVASAAHFNGEGLCTVRAR